MDRRAKPRAGGDRRKKSVVNFNSFKIERRRRLMALTEITAAKEVNGEKKTASIAKDLGENCQDAIDKFGAEVVHTNFKSAAKITAQAAMRRYMEAGKTAEEITTLMEAWKPGVAKDRVIDPVAALVSRWDSYTPKEQQEILAKLGKGNKK